MLNLLPFFYRLHCNGGRRTFAPVTQWQLLERRERLLEDLKGLFSSGLFLVFQAKNTSSCFLSTAGQPRTLISESAKSGALCTSRFLRPLCNMRPQGSKKVPYQRKRFFCSRGSMVNAQKVISSSRMRSGTSKQGTTQSIPRVARSSKNASNCICVNVRKMHFGSFALSQSWIFLTICWELVCA